MKNTVPASKLVAALSRRSFFGRAAVASSAVLLGSAMPGKIRAQENEGEDSACGAGLCDFPVPIPNINTPPPGGAHIYFPGPVSGAAAATDPSGAHPEGRDPSPIFNFQGFIGLADLVLTGTGKDLQTGASVPYNFHTDMRFMHGKFVGTDLIERKGSFAFVWLDSTAGSLGPHSWDAGVSPTNVVWVGSIPEGSVHVDLDEGTASLHVENMCVFDAFTVANSIAGLNRTVNPVKGIINSLKIEWSGVIKRDTANQSVNKMRGNFVENTATIEVTATTPKTAVTALSNGHGFRFVSNPASTSMSNFAEIGFEQNGIFF